MKLITKYNRINIVATIVVLLFSSVCYYLMIHAVLINQLDKDLKIEEHEIKDHVKLNQSLPDATDYKDQQMIFEPVSNEFIKRKFSSEKILNKKEHEKIATRQLVFTVLVAGQNYKVYIRKSQEETEDLVSMILLTTFGIVLLLLLILFVVNRFILNKLWQPFNNTLQQLRQFNLFNKTPLNLQASNISEFTDLNHSVTIMTSQVRQDYEALKSFTENASHEMQTPLAIINTRLDVLIQDDRINEQQMHQLQGIYDALERLSKLNQSLLLLTKIENNQFNSTEEIAVADLLTEKLAQFDDMITAKAIAVTSNLQPAAFNCNRQLADILISNLLNNAIRYNKPGGTVQLHLTTKELTVRNTSFLPALDEQKIFQRFYRHPNTKLEGNGLGLSIIRQICDEFEFAVRYTFNDQHHTFTIAFKPVAV